MNTPSTRPYVLAMALLALALVVGCSRNGSRRGSDGGVVRDAQSEASSSDSDSGTRPRDDASLDASENDAATDASQETDAFIDGDGGYVRVCGEEVCDNGLDEDCDGVVDDGCDCASGMTLACFGGDPTHRLQGVCRDGTMACEGGDEFGTWTDCVDDVTEQVEVCDVERVDEDCDGTANEGCDCVEGEPIPCGTDVGECVSGTQSCIGGRLGLCVGAIGPSVETCDALDNDCDGDADEDLSRVCGVNVGECRTGIAQCEDGVWGLCVGEIVASIETCNGHDDDCDGSTDESTDRACGTDTGECATGIERCVDGSYAECDETTGPVVEACNARDDDCDERIDEDVQRACGTDVGECVSGRQQCSAGTWLTDCVGSVQPTIERCNGLDDDCDDDIDEDLRRSCGTDVGECVAGHLVCSDGAWGTECLEQVGPVAETCNGLDDDCDGSTDENVTRSCGTDVGVCVAGVQRCVLGVWQMECEGEVVAGTEACDGVYDEDCDGTVDEACGCIAGTPRDCGSDVGLCEHGTQVCTIAGEWGACSGATGPAAEVCDGYDNDCDNFIDEGDVCPRFPPVAMCPAAANGTTGVMVSLSGSGSDPDGGSVSYEWSVTARPLGSTASLASALTANASFTPDVAGSYTFELCVVDEDSESTCCTVTLSVVDACTPPSAPALSVCGTSWDRRPIAELTPLPAGQFYELYLDAAMMPYGTVTSAGQNYYRPASAIGAGGAAPGTASTITARACRTDAPTCCSPYSSGTVLMVESCTTPRAPVAGDLIFSEYVIDGDGSCPGASCQAGEAVEITNLTNCPIALSGDHFFYCNGSCTSASYRWMNFGASDIIPPRGVYVAIRSRSSSMCSYPFFGTDDASLFGLKVSSLSMNGMNLDTGWFANGGGKLRLATGAYSSATAGTTLTSLTYASSAAPMCGSNGYDAINRCGEISATSTTYPVVTTNQLGRLWHPCDAVVGPVPSTCR